MMLATALSFESPSSSCVPERTEAALQPGGPGLGLPQARRPPACVRAPRVQRWTDVLTLALVALQAMLKQVVCCQLNILITGQVRLQGHLLREAHVDQLWRMSSATRRQSRCVSRGERCVGEDLASAMQPCAWGRLGLPRAR